MRDLDCVAFLQWALPQLGFRWPGFRKVRRQVCKRIRRRLRQLEIDDLTGYRQLLATHREEWQILDSLCRITISRFYRDRSVWQTLAAEVLPILAREAESSAGALRIWSAGCGAGEEPYTVAIIHELSPDPDLRAARIQILATDTDERQLQRARLGIFPSSCLRDLPPAFRKAAFEPMPNNDWRLRAAFKTLVEWRAQDLRRTMPEGTFQVILCRNLAFTYFDDSLQQRVLGRLLHRLEPGGFLVVGAHEEPLSTGHSLELWPRCRAILQKTKAG